MSLLGAWWMMIGGFFKNGIKLTNKNINWVELTRRWMWIHGLRRVDYPYNEDAFFLCLQTNEQMNWNLCRSYRKFREIIRNRFWMDLFYHIGKKCFKSNGTVLVLHWLSLLVGIEGEEKYDLLRGCVTIFLMYKMLHNLITR